MNSKTSSFFGLALAFAGLLVFSGCNDDSKQIADLKRRVNELESYKDKNIGSTVELFTNVSERISELEEKLQSATNTMNASWNVLIDRWVQTEDRIDGISNSVVALWSQRGVAVPQYKSTPSAATKNGVPIAIYDQIVADARKKWATEYDMQVYEINKQCAAWVKVNGGR